MIPNLIVPVLNRYDLLHTMFQSIDYPIRDLIIIDNGGEFYDVLYSEFVKNVYVLNLPSNLGVAASWNLGIKLLPHDDRWFFASNDMVYLPGALEKLSEARRDEITLCDMFPFWHTFCVGEEAVRRVGLFDEALYPAYFEDNDYQRRAEYQNIKIRSINIATAHQNSSTINSDHNLMGKNHQTFHRNSLYYEAKRRMNDYSSGEWSLETRRLNSWDNPR